MTFFVKKKMNNLNYFQTSDEENDASFPTGDVVIMSQESQHFEQTWNDCNTIFQDFQPYDDIDAIGNSSQEMPDLLNYLEGRSSQIQGEIPEQHQESVPPEIDFSYIPVTTPMPGNFSFQAIFESQNTESLSKSTSWTYSESLQQLYVNLNKQCIVQFKTNPHPPSGCFVRAAPVFTEAEHLMKVVERCPNHRRLKDNTNLNQSVPPEHLIRCGNPNAIYEVCQKTARTSVLVPFNEPGVGEDTSKVLYSFMCFTSCTGGMDRRPVQVVFTLEKDRIVIGRAVVKVRICAAPGRDRKNDEDKQKKKRPNFTRQNSGSSKKLCTQCARRRKEDGTYSGVFHASSKEQYDKIRLFLRFLEYEATEERSTPGTSGYRPDVSLSNETTTKVEADSSQSSEAGD